MDKINVDAVTVPKEKLEDFLRRPGSMLLHPTVEHYAEMFETWALGPVIETRDSGITDKSNARVLKRELEAAGFKEGDEWQIIPMSHWAVGHVDHLSFHVRENETEWTATRVARFIYEFYRQLEEEYPIADEDDHSELQTEEEWSYFEQQWGYLVRSGKVREDAKEKLGDVHEKLRNTRDPHEDSDEIPYYTEAEIVEAAKSLGFTSEDGDEAQS